jgi:hypothetical protein
MKAAPNPLSHLSILAMLALFAFGACCPGNAAENFQSLFDGKTLNGWMQLGGKAKYEVKDNCIVGSSVVNTPNSFLCTEKSYGDFILELELKADTNLNSGVQIRSHCYDHRTNGVWGGKTNSIPAGRVHGYQIEVDNRPDRRWSGGIYEESRRGWLFSPATNSPASYAFKFDEWNKYRIECKGHSIKTWINGVQTAELVDEAGALEGFIALQVHSASREGLQVRWRNIRIQETGK